MICKRIISNIFKESELIFFLQFSCFKYCNPTLIILFDIFHLLVQSWMVQSIVTYCLHTVKSFPAFLFCSSSSIYHPNDQTVRVFANSPGDRGSIPGRVKPKTQKWYLMFPWLILSIVRYGSRVKWSNPTPRCKSYWKVSLRVTLDYGRQHRCICLQLNGFQYSIR